MPRRAHVRDRESTASGSHATAAPSVDQSSLNVPAEPQITPSGDGSGSTDDGSGSFDNGSGSSNDGSGSFDDGSGSFDNGSGSLDNGAGSAPSVDPGSATPHVGDQLMLLWSLARASAFVAFGAYTGVVVWGILVAGRAFRPAAPAVAFHRLLASIGMVAIVVHVVALLFDSYAHVTIGSLFGLGPTCR